MASGAGDGDADVGNDVAGLGIVGAPGFGIDGGAIPPGIAGFGIDGGGGAGDDEPPGS